ncbi:MAG: hypothetical protein LBS31_11195 [Candidatus Adiutrix sp.]|nr:hypothetical protein [Candidatus Adiutrix sp.]
MVKVKLFFGLAFIVLSQSAAAFAQADIDLAMSHEGPLTQADVDAYVYLAPRLSSEEARNRAAALKLLAEVNLTKARAAYIALKIPVAQAMVMGVLNAEGLEKNDVPPYLRPGAAELALVADNLQTLLQAQRVAGAARRHEP